MGRRVFLRRCRPESVVHCPQSAVRSPQSAVRSPQSDVCNLYTVEFDASYITGLENRWQNRSNFFPACFAIAMFWKAKISFSLVKNIVFPRLQNMVLVWTQKWCKIFYLKMNRNISRGLNMLTQLRSYEPSKLKWVSSLKDIPQFFVHVSSFDITW